MQTTLISTRNGALTAQAMSRWISHSLCSDSLRRSVIFLAVASGWLLTGLSPAQAAEVNCTSETAEKLGSGDANHCVDSKTLKPATLSGRVFIDNGSGSGIAHNGVIDGSETGVDDVVVQLMSGTAVLAHARTAADGSYTLRLPDNSGPLSVVVKTPPDYLAVREDVGTTGVFNPNVLDAKISFNAIEGMSYSGVNFGDVRQPGMQPNHSRTAVPGTTVFLPHTFISNTSGNVRFSMPSSNVVLTPNISGWRMQLYRDSNCNGVLDGGELPLGSAVAVDANSHSKVCILLGVTVPVGAPVNSRFEAQIQAGMSYANTSLTSAVKVIDLVTVADSSALVLSKEVDSTSVQPGDTLTYTLHYTNSSAIPVPNLTILDSPSPPMTYIGGSARCIAPLPSGVTSCTINAQPVDGGTGPIEWALCGSLLSGAEGVVQFKAKIVK